MIAEDLLRYKLREKIKDTDTFGLDQIEVVITIDEDYNHIINDGPENCVSIHENNIFCTLHRRVCKIADRADYIWVYRDDYICTVEKECRREFEAAMLKLLK